MGIEKFYNDKDDATFMYKKKQTLRVALFIHRCTQNLLRERNNRRIDRIDENIAKIPSDVVRENNI